MLIRFFSKGADTKKSNLDIDPLPGEEVGKTVARFLKFVAVFVSAKTSPPIIKKLSEVFMEPLKGKEVMGLFKKVGMQVENLGPEKAGGILCRGGEDTGNH